MSSTTTNLGLTKPANSDYVDVAVINSNYDIIDQFAGGVPDDISDLSDVTISTPTNGQVLKYDSSSSKWVNANEEGGVSDLDDLTDVDLNNPSSGQILKYNSVSAKWENGNEVVPTTVIANPSATATNVLSKLQVGSSVYSVPQGGGGYEPNGVTYTIVNNATDDTQSGQAARSIVVNKFEDDVQTDTGSLSYATVVTTGPNNFTVGNVKTTYTLVSGTAYWILTVVSGYIQYDGNVYEIDDEILRTPVVGESVINITGVEEVASDQTTVTWNQIQASGTKVAEITINGATTNVLVPTPTDVVANPSGSATADLTSIQIGSTVYSVPQGGGSWTEGDTYYIFSFDNTSGGSITATEYLVDGGSTTQVQTGTISFASIIGGGPQYIEFSDIEIRWNASASTYNVNCLVDKVQYGGVQYGAGDNVFSVAQAGTSVSNQRIDKLVQGGSEVSVLTDLQDVTVSSVTGGQVLKFNSTSQKWENANEDSVSIDIDDLTDVDITTPSNAQVLAYDSTSSKWVNSTLPSTDLDDLTDVTLSTPSNGQVLKFNSSTNKWENANESGGGGGASALTDLTDVAVSSATNGQALVYDNATSKWVNGTQSVSGLSDTTITTPTNGQVLTYDSTSSKWVNGAGGGGTTVVANPSGTATDELDTVQIGNTIYEIPSGGGGGDSWTDVTGTLTAGQTQITLSDVHVSLNSTIDVYTDKFGIDAINQEIVAGQQSQLQPFVTSESELVCTVTADSYYDNFYPWKAFESSGETGWVGWNSSGPEWIAFEFSSSVKIEELEWICLDSNRAGTIDNLQYSSDGTSWTNCTLSTNERGHAVATDSITAKHWRMYFAGPYQSWGEPMITKLQLLTSVNGVRLTFPVQSENLGVKVRVS